MMGLHFSIESPLEIPRHLFHPPPNVDSAVLKLTRRPKKLAEITDEAQFRRVVKAGFAQRRKTLSNSLKSDKTLCADWAPVLEKAGVDGSRRAETLSIEEFAAIERALG
jgi:16S rRNA (adenine1518-N6/adenine1519-N6)-dimethyltransferase